jgi:ABC-type transport system involved in multi-copper enzyme maturation permease subunit
MSEGPRAAIHDLGYKRYLGTRRPQSTRWRVIVKNLIATSWRGWWRMKVWMIGALLTTVGVGIPMYLSRHTVVRELQAKGFPMTWADALVPMSFSFFAWTAFTLATTIAAAQVARDLRASAFEFYFSRPVRPIDYVAGKVGGIGIIMLIALAAGPLLLSLFRVGLSDDMDEVMTTLALVPRTALVGVLAALAYAVVPLALSTLAPRPRITVAMWVGFYFIFGPIVEGLSFVMRAPDLAALNLPEAVTGLAHGLYGVPSMFGPMPSVAASATALLGYIALGLFVLHWRVRSAERAGMGGG